MFNTVNGIILIQDYSYKLQYILIRLYQKYMYTYSNLYHMNHKCECSTSQVYVDSHSKLIWLNSSFLYSSSGQGMCGSRKYPYPNYGGNSEGEGGQRPRKFQTGGGLYMYDQFSFQMSFDSIRI